MHMLPVSFLTLMPLAFTSPLPLVEQRDASPGCTEASFGKFSWTVDNFDYHASYIFTTPAHQNSYGFLNFTLSNPALPSAAICSASSSQLSDFFYGNIWYTCNIPDSGHEGTATAFAFNRASGQLDFNQTWSCSDEDAQYPITFRGYATVNLTLDCTDTTWTNSNWTMGDIYSDREVKCTPVTLPVQPYTMTAVA
ncbi:hypothetical protein NKR19_g6445 [Coniochaeta hoffmannii]|uniref:AA1-like domain-containing protein n=1 Tax=Coniochaeta hoffmannii TaxID=91930 RepID=A0AA38RMC9_9PEZI|nr:hypothetical protein NKR19_g6445 [Coniochaeta hoffmannii]